MTTPQSPPIALDASTEITRPNFRAERPISVPYAGGVKALDERGMLMRGNSPRSKVGERMSVGEDTCWGCTKRVYAAEQVSAGLVRRGRGLELGIGHVTMRLEGEGVEGTGGMEGL